MPLAPVALFVYKRLSHTKRTIEALLQNAEASQTQLVVYSDGPKTSLDSEVIEQLRQYIRSISGFSSVQLIEREQNLGLSQSIIQGVSQLTEQFGSVIVLEDDLVVSPYFLKYMNDALVMYENNPKVISIHGYVYPIEGLPETYFLKGADCWGWATWRRGWALFESDGQMLLNRLLASQKNREFDFNGQSAYTQMLRDQVDGKIDSWAIRWYASAFLQNRFTLYPGRSLVRNIGQDGSGTHSQQTTAYDSVLRYNPIDLARQPVEQNYQAYELFSKYFYTSRPKVLTKLRNRVRRLFA
ncbi:MAG: glycosyl transferase [Legionellales bacterium]|nr:glycosyl transferase [Legionellales bacterium]|tara:strand:+ start:655 stop:1548 length:894 start_codon:yes stop_codon:yes gene_type:complete